MNKLICNDTPGTAETADPAGFEKACADGLALAKRLGNGWSAHVHENLGWHYTVWNAAGSISVHEYKRPKQEVYYNASIHEKPFECGSPLRCCFGKTPETAIKATIAEARKEAKRWTDMLEGL